MPFRLQAPHGGCGVRRVKVRIDYELCQGHGVCAGEAPAVFSIDDEGRTTVLVERPDEALRERIAAAKRYCPQQAVIVEED